MFIKSLVIASIALCSTFSGCNTSSTLSNGEWTDIRRQTKSELRSRLRTVPGGAQAAHLMGKEEICGKMADTLMGGLSQHGYVLTPEEKIRKRNEIADDCWEVILSMN